MKKLAVLSLMCLLTMVTSAQVLTSKTVNDVYEQMTLNDEKGFAYNAEHNEAGVITTMYVYRRKGDQLKPHCQYQYDYDDKGLLQRRTILRWKQGAWRSTARLDYQLQAGSYTVELSRWNKRTRQFDAPMERMTYALTEDRQVDYISSYHRDHAHDAFRLTERLEVSHSQQSASGYLTLK